MPEEQAAQLHQMAYDYIFTLWNCLYTLESPTLPEGVPPTEFNLLPYEFADVYIEEAKDDPSLAFAEPPTVTLTSPSDMMIYYTLHAEEGPVVSNYQYRCTVQGISRTGKPLKYQLNYKPTFRCDENGQWYFEEQGGIVWNRGGTDGRYGNALSDLIRRTGR